MNVMSHRIAAASILAVGLVVVVAWGRSMGVETGPIRDVRARFQGSWAASSIRAGEHRQAEGEAAAHCSAVFDAKRVDFHGLVGGIDARGTFYLDPSKPGWVDFKLDEGWIVGIYEFDGDRLKLCLNPFAPPERLGVPTLARPKGFYSGETRHVYVFERAKM